MTGLEIQMPATANGKFPRSIIAMKIAGIISKGIGKKAQKIPMAMPLAVV